MKITTIKYMERKNLGNYEHEELSAEAVIGETEDYTASMISLKDLVHNTLHGTLNKTIVDREILKEVAEASVEKIAEVKEKIKRVTKVKEKLAEVVAGSLSEVEKAVDAILVEAEIVEEVKKEKPSKVTKYSSDVPEHKSIFGSYLAKAYGDTWKTVKPAAEIKAFTSSLNGQDFIDNNGIIEDSFLLTVKKFFCA